MSWIDRLRPGISLTSPEGNEFSAKWRGDDITISKRVNRQAHPDLDGESAQDLGLNASELPLTLYFDGPDHDTDALRFSRAIAERGIWNVTHPVYGLLRLQPVKITLRARPVESGNITEISGDWLEPVPDIAAIGPAAASRRPGLPSVETAAKARNRRSAAASSSSAASSARKTFPVNDTAAVENAVSDLAERTIDDASQISTRTGGGAAVTEEVARQSRTALDIVRDDLRSFSAHITEIMGTIDDLIMRPYLDIAAISGAAIQLFESPGIFLGNISSRVSMFVKLGNSIATVLPAVAKSSLTLLAAALTREMWINAVACGIGTMITQGLPETRAEALSILSQYRTFAVNSRDALDALAKAASGNTIEEQYFPRATSAEAVLTLNAAIARYIMGIAFDLKAEKRIVLERPTNPMMVAIREYGVSAASADTAFDLLCRSNNLHGKELLLLDRMREIVIYA